MRTANEIALETKIEELEKEIKSLKEFEHEICMTCAKLMMTTMFLGKDNHQEMLKLALPAFDKLLDVVKERREKKVKAQMK